MSCMGIVVMLSVAIGDWQKSVSISVASHNQSSAIALRRSKLFKWQSCLVIKHLRFLQDIFIDPFSRQTVQLKGFNPIFFSAFIQIDLHFQYYYSFYFHVLMRASRIRPIDIGDISIYCILWQTKQPPPYYYPQNSADRLRQTTNIVFVWHGHCHSCGL